MMLNKKGQIRTEYQHHITPLFSSSTGLPMSIGPLAGPVFPMMVVYDFYDIDGRILSWDLATFAVAVCDEPEILYGKNKIINNSDIRKIFNYVKTNKSALLKHWCGEYDSAELVAALKKIDTDVK